jgi:hypothetical protein
MMKTSDHRTSYDPHDPVDLAIAAALLEPIPCEPLARTLKTATAWELESAGSAGPWWSSRWATAAIAASLAAAILVSIHLVRRPGGVDRQAFVQHGESPKVQSFTFFEKFPVTNPLVAERAPIFVVTPGPDQSQTLGAEVLRKDLRPIRLHVWDWSQSKRSRVLDIPDPRGAQTLSPDGRWLLGYSGRGTNLVTAEVRTFDGFAVTNRQGISHVKYSGSGKYVAILIVDRSDEPAWKDPAWRPRFFLRIVELASGRILGEFAAAGNVLSAFAPDDAYIVYAFPAEATRQHRVARRDLPSLQIAAEYTTYGDVGNASRSVDNSAFECVGTACSADGSLIAAAFYYGEVFVWESASSKRLLQFRAKRDDGTRDTFFGAELMSFSADGGRLAAVAGSRLAMIETRSGEVTGYHYSPSTPEFAHVRWTDDGRRVLLVARSQLGDFADDDPVSEFLPNVYEWDGTKEPQPLKAFAADD